MVINKKTEVKFYFGFLINEIIKNYSATTSNLTSATMSLYKRTFAV
jgi:hypothetical protein